MVGRPNSSWLNQLPSRPMACATASPGATASSSAGKASLRRRATRYAPSTPKTTAPQIPRPPCQILSASIGVIGAPPEVELVVGDHVIEPGADDAGRHRDHDAHLEALRRPATGHPAPAGDDHPDDDPGDDAQCVRPQREAEDVPDPGRWTRDEERTSAWITAPSSPMRPIGRASRAHRVAGSLAAAVGELVQPVDGQLGMSTGAGRRATSSVSRSPRPCPRRR